MKAAQDNFCPAAGCTASFRTMDGLHDHIEDRHPGETINSLSGNGHAVSGAHCPVDGCTETFETADEMQGHISGKSPHDDDHETIRDSSLHSGTIYDVLINGK